MEFISCPELGHIDWAWLNPVPQPKMRFDFLLQNMITMAFTVGTHGEHSPIANCGEKGLICKFSNVLGPLP